MILRYVMYALPLLFNALHVLDDSSGIEVLLMSLVVKDGRWHSHDHEEPHLKEEAASFVSLQYELLSHRQLWLPSVMNLRLYHHFLSRILIFRTLPTFHTVLLALFHLLDISCSTHHKL